MRRLFLIVGVVIITASVSTLAVVYQRHHPSSRCYLDGSNINHLYEVIIIQKDKLPRNFSCVFSARMWFSRNSREVSSILVTDEATGKKIKAQEAYYVVSEVITTPYTGNRVHVFGERSSAMLHARKFKGKMVENPFQAQEEKPIPAKYRTNSPYPAGPDLFFPSYQHPLCLPTETPSLKGDNCWRLFYRYPLPHADGYLSPPEKIPITII